MTPVIVTIDYDDDPDFSWLEQECFADTPAGYRDPANHVALEMVAWDEQGEVTDALGGIDFLAAENDWTTGTFSAIGEIPARCDYLREIARQMGLPE